MLALWMCLLVFASSSGAVAVGGSFTPCVEFPLSAFSR